MYLLEYECDGGGIEGGIKHRRRARQRLQKAIGCYVYDVK
jgi:hypothetical protein